MSREVEFQIPFGDEYEEKSVEILSAEQKLMARSFSETTSNKIFSIQYELEFYVKHDSVTERGKGNLVRFPIIINS